MATDRKFSDGEAARRSSYDGNYAKGVEKLKSRMKAAKDPSGRNSPYAFESQAAEAHSDMVPRKKADK